MAVLLGTIVTALTVGALQAAAFPMFYNDRQMGCEIPGMAFADHMEPVVNPDVVFMITDAAGMPAESFVSGEEYTVSMDAYAATTNAWVHATDGTPAVLDAGAVADCGLAWYSLEAADSHTFSWTAPMTSECVTMSAAQATGSMDAYNTATAEFCPEDVGAAALVPAGAPAAAVSSAPEPASTAAAVPAPPTSTVADASTEPAATDDTDAPAPSGAASLAAVAAAGAAFAAALF